MLATTGFRIGRLFGIQIHVDWSFLIIFLLITFSLAKGVFPAWHPDWSEVTAWMTAFIAAILLFASVLAHELSHSLVGRTRGIEVRRITLFIFGGMAHMENEPDSWRAELTMAIAGPIMSLLLGFGFIWLGSLLAGPMELFLQNPEQAFENLSPLATLLLWLGQINIVLAIFNLVPGFPLDGGRVLRSILWAVTGNIRLATQWASLVGQSFAWGLMAVGVMMLFGIFGGSNAMSGLWLMFIGWFLNRAALASYGELLLRQSLHRVPVSRLMHTRFIRIGPAMPISELVDKHLMSTGQRAFPVEKDGHVVGIISLRDIQKLPRDRWQTAKVEDIMMPSNKLRAVTPEDDAMTTLTTLGQHDLNQLLVVKDDILVGMIRREDILKWLSLSENLPAAVRKRF